MGKALKITLVVLAAAVAATLTVAYYTFDPASTPFAPRCLFRVITGWECPGCGSQRMLHALLHGDFAAAWQYNAFLMIMLPVLALLAYASFRRRRYPMLYARLNSPAMIIALTVLLIAWAVLRNIFNI